MNDEDQLRTILKSWGQFPAATEADFNCLLQEVMSALNEGSDRETLEAVIQNEFYSHHGTGGPVEAIMDVAKTISEWWASDKT